MISSKEVIGALPIGAVVCSSKYTYEVLEVIGSGGFGITYKVIRQQDDCAFAMKEYYPSQMCERNVQDYTLSYLKTNSQSIKNGIEDFITEAKRLDKQNLSHPNLVAIDEVFKTNNTAYYVMEFIDGCNLRQLINKNKKKPIAVDQALNILQPILQAVTLLHEHRLTHLDIKPDNIIVTQQPDGTLRPVLIDFGQAKHYDKKGNATSKLTNAGCSDGFASPEQYMGLTKFTPQADVYALSATLLYLISAKQPVISGEITAKDIKDMLPDDIPPYIENAIVNGMRRNKDDRTQSVELLADALKLDIARINNDITDDLSLTRLIKPKIKFKLNFNFAKRNIESAKILKYMGTLLVSVAVISGIIWLMPNHSVTETEVLDEVEQPEQVEEFESLYNDSIEADSVILEQPRERVEQPSQQTVDNSSKQNDTNTNVQLVSSAKNIAEMRSLANKKIPESYAPLSKMEFNEGNYDAAANYAKMAMKVGKATSDSKWVLSQLEEMGY